MNKKTLTEEQKNVLFKEKFMVFHLIGAIFIITGIVLSSKKISHD